MNKLLHAVALVTPNLLLHDRITCVSMAVKLFLRLLWKHTFVISFYFWNWIYIFMCVYVCIKQERCFSSL